MTFRIDWIDSGREPQLPANPAFPDGVDVDLSERATTTCVVDLPYPAKRCGAYRIQCDQCGTGVMVTTAGRADDPRAVRIACRTGGLQ
jgi:hypothetical protein